jgi:polyisoprenoid-binding protein YceI
VSSDSHIYSIDPKQTEASYQVQEQFLNRPLPNTALGKTSTLQGGFIARLSGTPAITALKVTIDLRTLTSDSGRRDNSIRGHWLESDTYPLATFVVKTPQPLPAGASQGQQASFKLTGDMTVRNVTHQETFTVQGKLTGSTVSGKATSLVYMKDFGFDAPSIMGLLTVKDGATLSFNFTANQGGCPQLS